MLLTDFSKSGTLRRRMGGGNARTAPGFERPIKTRKDSPMTTLFAYINPFIGSLFLQLLALGFVFVSVFAWKVKTFFLGLSGIKQETHANAETTDSSTVTLGDKEDKKAA